MHRGKKKPADHEREVAAVATKFEEQFERPDLSLCEMAIFRAIATIAFAVLHLLQTREGE